MILISIGDDEVAHLRLLMDEIFGEVNFVAHIVWQKRYVSNVTAQFLSDMHDHILVFARRREAVTVKKIEREEEQLEDYKNPDDDPRDVWRAQDLSASKPYDGGSPFDTPKPVKLLRRMLELFSDSDSIVLDSFAGSGTTGHAVLETNAEDGGKRSFVLVQQPHDTKQQESEQFNICEKVTAERMRRVIQGYKRPNGDGEGVKGLGGSFTYARLGPRLFGEYRDLGDNLPAFEELAKYVFYTETSQDFDPKAGSPKTGKIGEFRGTAYYLLYTPNGKEDRALDLAWLKQLPRTEDCRKLVVYCEKLWVHRDDLAKWEKETKRTVRPMLVPFNLK